MTTTHYNPVDEWVERCFAGTLSAEERKAIEADYTDRLSWPQYRMVLTNDPTPNTPHHRKHALTHLVCQGNFVQVQEMECCKLCYPEEK